MGLRRWVLNRSVRFNRLMLEIVGVCLSTCLANNEHLLYALLHKQDVMLPPHLTL